MRFVDDSELTLDVLTAGVSVFQRRKGHRFSSDDVVTAWAAMQVCPEPALVLDLGCGLGSVLLHVAWSAPDCRLVGIEAQDVSFALATRNVAHNGVGNRVEVYHGDIREALVIETAAGGRLFDLVTGTPPYFPPDTSTDSLDEQRAFARIEYRGGVEAYVDAAVRVMTPDGWFVMCGDSDAEGRLVDAASATGLVVCRRHVVTPRSGRPPLFTVWALRRATVAESFVDRPLVMRDAAGDRTPDARMIRAFSGIAE